jgi:DNA-binding MarR family transcriptional regulator
MPIHNKSVISYRKMQEDGIISIRQEQVLRCLEYDLGYGTNRMIAQKLGWDINRVTGRMTELRNKGLVVHAGDHYDEDTNRTVNLWKCL